MSSIERAFQTEGTSSIKNADKLVAYVLKRTRKKDHMTEHSKDQLGKNRGKQCQSSRQGLYHVVLVGCQDIDFFFSSPSCIGNLDSFEQ